MEQRRVIIEAVKKFSSLAKKGSASRADFRKSFFPVTKHTQPMVRPWPSTTNISYPAQSSISTSIEGSPSRKDSFKSLHRQSSTEDSDGRPSVSSQSERNQEGVINSAFTGEKPDDTPGICDCDKEGEKSDPSYQCQCGQRVARHQPSIPETIDMSVIDSEPNRPRVNSHSRYLVTRRSKLSPSWRNQEERSVQWRLRIPGKPFRRRTTDSVPRMDTILSQTKSSPNLRNLEEQARITRSLKTERSCKQEDDSQL